MNTTATGYQYKPRDNYSYRQAKPKPFDVTSSPPVRDEVAKCLHTQNITATFTEDKQTISLLQNPSLISFLCTLRVGNKVISEGRGASTFGQYTRYVSRTVRAAFYASLTDAIARCSRIDALLPDLASTKAPNTGVVVHEAAKSNEDTESDLATEKQQEFLRQLIHSNIEDRDEQERYTSQLSELTKQEASRMIASFRG